MLSEGGGGTNPGAARLVCLVGRRSGDHEEVNSSPIREERECLFEAEVVEALIEVVEVAASTEAAAATTSEVEAAVEAAAISEAAAGEDLDEGVAAEALTKAKTKDLQNV